MSANEQINRTCPRCKEIVQAGAIKCKHCSAFLTPEHAPHGGTCPFCKEQIHKDATKCKHCKTDLAVMSGNVPVPVIRAAFSGITAAAGRTPDLGFSGPSSAPALVGKATERAAIIWVPVCWEEVSPIAGYYWKCDIFPFPVPTD
jgi:hypothetical protein